MRHAASFIVTSLTALALASGAAAGGGHGGGGGGGLGGGMGGGFGAGGRFGGSGLSAGGSFGEASRINSQGSLHASSIAKGHADDEHSAIFDQPTAVTSGALAGLSRGMTVKDQSGVTVGTVSKILRSDNGVVRVLVASSGGSRRTLSFAPSSLSISRGVVTTSRTSIH